MTPLLTVKNLSIQAGKRVILHDLSFEVNPRESVVIIGANGAGKTMLIKTLMGFIKPAAGTIEWKKKVKIGYVPQKFALDRTVPLTVREFLGLKGNTGSHEIAHCLKEVGLEPAILDKPMGTLSGGQAQRALIAWALLGSPDVLIFDEPAESIDIAGQSALYELLDTVKKEKGISVFLVSHDLDVVYTYADRVLCIADGAMICSADPRNVLDQKKLQEVYGPHAKTYHH